MSNFIRFSFLSILKKNFNNISSNFNRKIFCIPTIFLCTLLFIPIINSILFFQQRIRQQKIQNTRSFSDDINFFPQKPYTKNQCSSQKKKENNETLTPSPRERRDNVTASEKNIRQIKWWLEDLVKVLFLCFYFLSDLFSNWGDSIPWFRRLTSPLGKFWFSSHPLLAEKKLISRLQFWESLCIRQQKNFKNCSNEALRAPPPHLFHTL